MARTKTFVDLDTASKNLNMSVSAIRKRLQRGTFSGKKNAKGAWVLQLTPEIMDMGRTVAGQRLIKDETSEKITEDNLTIVVINNKGKTIGYITKNELINN